MENSNSQDSKTGLQAKYFSTESSTENFKFSIEISDRNQTCSYRETSVRMSTSIKTHSIFSAFSEYHNSDAKSKTKSFWKECLTPRWRLSVATLMEEIKQVVREKWSRWKPWSFKDFHWTIDLHGTFYDLHAHIQHHTKHNEFFVFFCIVSLNMLQFLLLSVEQNSKGKYLIQLSESFSFYWKCPWRAEFKSAESLLSSIRQVSGFTAFGKPELVNSNTAVGHNFYILSDTR